MITLIEIRIITSFILLLNDIPTIAFFDNDMSIISKGITTGKLKTAINVKLFPALDAIAETIVNPHASPELPSTKAIPNKNKFAIGFPITTL